MTVTYCCPKCFSFLQKNGGAVCGLWVELCRHYLKQNGNLVLQEQLIPDAVKFLRMLESWGFIKTLDGENVTIRMEGHLTEVDDFGDPLNTFCANREEHDRE